MLILTSPAKTLLEDAKLPKNIEWTMPRSLPLTTKLANSMRKLSPEKIAKLMSINEKLTFLNFERFQAWQPDHNLKNSRPALFMYYGDIYRQLHPQDYSASELNYAQDTVRMISGLYGSLRPFDLMQPYRLEMKLTLPGHKQRLSKLWQQECTRTLIEDCKTDKLPLVINLASKEYEAAISLNELPAKVIHVDFKEYRADKLKTVAINSKRARGLMIDYCIKNQVTDLDTLKDFNLGDYQYESTSGNRVLFIKR